MAITVAIAPSPIIEMFLNLVTRDLLDFSFIVYALEQPFEEMSILIFAHHTLIEFCFEFHTVVLPFWFSSGHHSP
jgi:hypothetical protein